MCLVNTEMHSWKSYELHDLPRCRIYGMYWELFNTWEEVGEGKSCDPFVNSMHRTTSHMVPVVGSATASTQSQPLVTDLLSFGTGFSHVVCHSLPLMCV